jgi:thymidylate kinase
VDKAKSESSGVVIFDRYIYDQLAALPMNSWWARTYARLVLKLAPQPDLSYLLDAVPEEARARKPEYPLEFMRKYRMSYLVLQKLAGLQLIAAAAPDDVHTAIVDRFETRVMNDSSAWRASSAVVA